MATTTSQISVAKTSTGLLRLPQTDEAAEKVGELLTKDMARHHVFFNASGFHNHIVHHLLALYATGASIAALEQAYRENAAYQLPVGNPDPAVVSALSSSSTSDLATARKYLAKGPNYSSFLSYFQSEIARLGGIPQTLLHHLFSGTPRAEDLLVRLHAGFLHPLIHLMYGLEFNLSDVVAQALAQAAVHKDSLRDFLLTAENMSRELKTGGKMSPISTLYETVRKDEKLRTSARFSDDQKITDGVLVRAKDEMLALAARVRVREDELEERTWEMYENALFMTFGSAGCAKGKREKVDFFFMHHANSSPLYISLLSLQAIPNSAKARLLEWKIRLDLLQYTARGAPPLSLDFLSDSMQSKDAFEKLHFLHEDGHAIKLARAVEVFRRTGGGGGSSGKRLFAEDGIGDKLLAFVVDTTGREGERKWVRSAGMEEAWKDIPDKEPGK